VTAAVAATAVPATRTVADAASAAPASAAPRRRDEALDLLRSLALFRVILWHAFAATWMTTIAAMPVMFFVAGSLLGSGGTGGRGSYVAFLRRRARRLLLPFWAYGAAVAATMIYVPLGDERWATAGGIALRALTWFLPLVDPVDSTWHGGWLSNHLWYLRAYLWIVVLAPAVVALARHLRASIPLLLVALAQLEVLSRLGVDLPGGPGTRVVIGDVLAYGLFAVLGVAFAEARTAGRLPKRSLLAVTAVAAAVVAVGYAVRYGLPDGGVNGSYPLIVATGAAWLLGVGSIEPWVRRIAEVPRVGRWTAAVSSRAVTIYLWHPAAIVVAQALLPDALPVRPLAVVGATAALVGSAVVLVGWIEDVAGGRSHLRLPSLPLARLTMIVPATALILAITVPVLVTPPDARATGVDGAPGAAGARGLRPPSYREALGNAAFSRQPVPREAPFVLEDGQLPRKDLQRAVQRWVEETPEVSGADVGLVVQGQVWRGSTAGRGRAAQEPFRIHSLTKTFTMTLVLQEVAAGRIQLDAPLPLVRGIRRPPAALPITPRHLVSHTSGLADYTASPFYDAERIYGPHEAVNLSLRQPLLHPVGSAVHYANSNFLYLGLLLEQVTGRPYGDLLGDLAARAGLRETRLEESTPGWVGFSSGGIVSTMSDLTRWGAALFTPDRILPAPLLAEATALSDTNIGLGLWPLCPCGTDAAGRKQATAIGHEVGYGALLHYPGQMTVLIRLEPPGPALTPFLEDLGEVLRDVLRGD